jgi:hypothetical protein
VFLYFSIFSADADPLSVCLSFCVQVKSFFYETYSFKVGMPIAKPTTAAGRTESTYASDHLHTHGHVT